MSKRSLNKYALLAAIQLCISDSKAHEKLSKDQVMLVLGAHSSTPEIIEYKRSLTPKEFKFFVDMYVNDKSLERWPESRLLALIAGRMEAFEARSIDYNRDAVLKQVIASTIDRDTGRELVLTEDFLRYYRHFRHPDVRKFAEEHKNSPNKYVKLAAERLISTQSKPEDPMRLEKQDRIIRKEIGDPTYRSENNFYNLNNEKSDDLETPDKVEDEPQRNSYTLPLFILIALPSISGVIIYIKKKKD
ncbi:hypothetical protein [Rubritalea tangerina]|uniref:Uncharacterized protein n=1 Tax=Rubritalea tangerina TaxID=430798 RepID=A0ABW4ZDT8_9BACT